MKKNIRCHSGCYRSDMQGFDRMLSSMTYTLSDTCITLNNELLLARPLDSNAYLYLEYEDHKTTRIERVSKSVLLATHDCININVEKTWSCEKFPLTQISTLFCFLDYQTSFTDTTGSDYVQSKNESSQQNLVDGDKYIVSVLDNGDERLMDILIRNMLNPDSHRLANVFRFVRNMESYWIAYFLLSQVFNGDSDSDATKLYNACKVYGVSESYFRKLCHNAFTCGPKKQLRMWRAAHSALQLIEKDKSIATIAGNNGYSSSSHFSSEIKSIFGITPREFKRLEGLLHD